MSGTVPVAVWAVQVPPGDELVSGVAGYDAMVSCQISHCLHCSRRYLSLPKSNYHVTVAESDVAISELVQHMNLYTAATAFS